MNFYRLFLLLFLMLPSCIRPQTMINFYAAACITFLGASLFYANRDMNNIREEPEMKNLLYNIENQYWNQTTLVQKKDNLLKLYDFCRKNHSNSLHISLRSFLDNAFYLRNTQNPTGAYLNQHRKRLSNALKQRDQFGPFCFFALSGCLILHEFLNKE